MNGYDGKIVIKSEIDNTEFDKQVADLDKEINNIQDKIQKIWERKGTTEHEISGQRTTEALTLEEQEEINKLYEQQSKLVEQKRELLSVDKEIEQVEEQTNNATIETVEATRTQTAQISTMSSKLEQMVNTYNSIKKGNIINSQDLQDAEILKKDIIELKEQIEELSGQQITIKGITDIEETLPSIKDKISEIGKGLEGVTKKVSRWALGIFGIRSAYMMVRSAMSVISSNDEKLANDITYIKNVLAYALEPVVRTIVAWAKQLLYYVGYIIKAFTGYDIFANANKNLKNATGNAKKLNKELNKTTASFDEMNILQKQSDSGGGDSGLANSKMQLGDTPEWMKSLLPTITGIVAGVTALLKGMKLIKALGLAIVVAGIVKLIQDVIDYLKDPSWEKFADILIDIGIILAGLALMFTSLPLAVAGAIVLILGLIAKFWDSIKEFLSNLIKNIYKLGDDIKKWLHEKLGIFGDIIGVFVDSIVGAVTSAVELILDLFDGLFGGLKDIADGIVSLFKDGVGEGLKKIFKGVANVIITALNAVVDGLNTIFAPMRAIIMVAGNILGKNWTMDDVKIPKIPKLERGGIVHNPGPGVLMGNYIAGEGSSPEAVLPLDDDTMDRLGEKIAKHMTINADIKNYMNGRLISRELHKIDNENNFAYNG